MTQTEILDKIKKAEKEAANSIKKADNNKEIALNKARIEREEIIKKVKKTAEEGRKIDLSKAQKTLDRERDKIVSRGDKENRALGKKARGKVNEAAERFIEKFMESV